MYFNRYYLYVVLGHLHCFTYKKKNIYILTNVFISHNIFYYLIWINIFKTITEVIRDEIRHNDTLHEIYSKITNVNNENF